MLLDGGLTGTPGSNLRLRLHLIMFDYRKKTCSHHFALGIGPGAAARTINGAGA